MLAAGGFQGDLDWLARAWGPAARDFLIRGTPYDRGVAPKGMIDQGAESVGNPTQCHAVAIFAPAFLAPLVAIAVGLGRYRREVGGEPVTLGDLGHALRSAAGLRNLSGGQGQGCNFERGDRYSDRRRAHRAAMVGFLLCFASTASGTLLHPLFAWEAPYPWWAPPKLLGVPGGLLLVAGCGALAWLKTKADPSLGAPAVWGGEMAFTLLLGLTGLSGLVLYAATGTAAVGPLLALHLGTVLALFLLAPYAKMAHGFSRMAALVRHAQSREGRAPRGWA